MTKIYVDSLVDYGAKGKWCHLWCDTLTPEGQEELDKFARKIRLKRTWKQLSSGKYLEQFFHYDLTESKRKLAIKNGAIELELATFIGNHFASST